MFKRNDSTFQGYSVKKERGPTFMCIVQAERDANRMWREWCLFWACFEFYSLDEGLEALGLYPMEVIEG